MTDTQEFLTLVTYCAETIRHHSPGRDGAFVRCGAEYILELVREYRDGKWVSRCPPPITSTRPRRFRVGYGVRFLWWAEKQADVLWWLVIILGALCLAWLIPAIIRAWPGAFR